MLTADDLTPASIVGQGEEVAASGAQKVFFIVAVAGIDFVETLHAQIPGRCGHDV